MSTVLLVDVDATRFGNLALMKLSAWHQKKGDTVTLFRKRAIKSLPKADFVYASCVFNKNKGRWLESGASIGGWALDPDAVLEASIEHIMPDYDLYGLDCSMGFTTRGCIRNCQFCIVKQKEGPLKVWADWREFYDSRLSRIKLLDNNLLAAPNCLETLQSLARTDVKVDFNQGLDIRLVTDEIAYWLSKVKSYRGVTGIAGLRFAFDTPGIEKQLRESVRLLTSRINHHTLNFYVLVGFNTTFEEDIHRFHVLKELGVYAFPMFFTSLDGIEHLPAPAPVGRPVTSKEVGHGARFAIVKYLNLVNRLNMQEEHTA